MVKKTRLQKRRNYKQKSSTRVKKTRMKRAGKKRASRKLYGGAGQVEDIIKDRLNEITRVGIFEVDTLKTKIAFETDFLSKTANCKGHEHTRAQGTTFSNVGNYSRKKFSTKNKGEIIQIYFIGNKEKERLLSERFPNCSNDGLNTIEYRVWKDQDSGFVGGKPSDYINPLYKISIIPFISNQIEIKINEILTGLEKTNDGIKEWYLKWKQTDPEKALIEFLERELYFTFDEKDASGENDFIELKFEIVKSGPAGINSSTDKEIKIYYKRKDITSEQCKEYTNLWDCFQGRLIEGHNKHLKHLKKKEEKKYSAINGNVVNV